MVVFLAVSLKATLYGHCMVLPEQDDGSPPSKGPVQAPPAASPPTPPTPCSVCVECHS